MVDVRPSRSAGKLPLRSALLLSSAIGVGLAGQAQAQTATVERTGPGDINYDTAGQTVTGAPEAIYLATDNGSITAKIGTVSGVGAGGNYGDVVEVTTLNDVTPNAGALNVTIGSLTATGDGAVRGLYTWSGTGVTTINVDSVDVSGTAGIFSQGDGDINITAKTVKINSTDPDFESAAIAVGRIETAPPESDRIKAGANVTINVGSIEARGNDEVEAIAVDAIGNISVTAGTIVSEGAGLELDTNDGDVNVALNGNVTTVDGAVSAGGKNVSIAVAEGVTVQSAGGTVEAEGGDTVNVTIDSKGRIISTGDEDSQGAIFVEAPGTINVKSAYAESNDDNTSLDRNGPNNQVSAVEQRGTIMVRGEAEAVSITAATTVANGAGMRAIDVQSTSGNIAISATDTTTNGNSVVNPSTVMSGNPPRPTTTVFTQAAAGIAATSQSGNISITSNKVTVNGSGNPGIVASTAGTINIDSAAITGAGTGAGNAGIIAIGDRGVTVKSGTITVNNGVGINAISNLQANSTGVNIDAGTVTVTGTANNNGNIVAGNSGMSGDTVIKVGTVTGATASTANTPTSGYNSASAIFGRAVNGAVTITADNVRNDSTQSLTVNNIANGGVGSGISATGRGVTIMAGNVEAQGWAIRALTNEGTGNTAAIPLNDSKVSITTTGAVTSRATNAISIGANVASFDVTIEANSVVTGHGSAALAGGARTGDINVANRGKIVGAQGSDGAIGVTATGGGNVTVTSNITEVSSTTAVTGGFLSGAIAARSQGGNGNVSVTSETATVTGPGRYGIYAEAQGTGAILIDSGTVTNTSAGTSSAIYALGRGGVKIISDAVTMAGEGADPGVNQAGGFRNGTGGIVVNALSGAVSIDSGSVNVAGDNRYGIFVDTGDAVDVISDSLTYTSKDSAGIFVVGGEGDVKVDSGVLNSTGTSGAGVIARTTSGDITIIGGQTTLSDTGYEGNYTADGLVALSETGNASITGGTTSVAGLYSSALYAQGANATVVSTAVNATGADGSLVGARALNGDATITSGTLNSTGAGTQALYATATGKATVVSTTLVSTGEGSTGILATGTQGATVTTGAISTVDAAVDVRSISGVSDVNVTGAVVSTAGYGIRASGANVDITVAAAGSVSGATTGITAAGGTSNLITNNGTVSGGNQPAIVSATGATQLVNAGTINAGTGPNVVPAVVLGTANDIVTLKTGSVINGIVATGGGTDQVVLSGTTNTATSTQTMARFAGAESLLVESGYWTASSFTGSFLNATINQGAAFEVRDAGEAATIEVTGGVVNNGTLALNFAAGTVHDVDGLVVSGTGGARLIGQGTIVFDDTAGLTYTGGTVVENGTLQLVGSYGGNVTTSGAGVFQLGNGGTVGDFTGDLVNNGTFLFDRTDAYRFAGDFSGSGRLIKNGAGTLTFAGLYGFEGITTINGGSVAFTGQLSPTTQIDLNEGTLDLSQVEGGEQTIGELSGSNQGSVNLGDSELTVNQTSNTTFAGTITGTGGLVKEGSGTLDLTGTNTYTGDTVVEGGTLKVNGALPNSTVVVDQGGTLGGNGTVGGLEMTGGTLAPGNSIGRLTVNGPVTFTAASVYAVEVNAAGQADRIDATGSATLGGATLQVLAEPGRYGGRTSYTILTAAGGVSGNFGTVTSNFAFLTPSVTYGANAVTLNLTRNNASFASLGTTPNARAVGGALQALGAGNTLFEEALLLQDTSVSPNFNSLSGEIHSGVVTGLIEDAQSLRRAMLTPTSVSDEEGGHGWAQLIGNWGTADATAANARMETEQRGLLGGVAFGGMGLKATIGVGMLTSDYRGAGNANVDTQAVVAGVGYSTGGFSLNVGASYASHDVRTRRVATLGSISNSLTDDYNAKTFQAYGDVAFGVVTGAVEITPFAGVSYVETKNDDTTEFGGPTALTIRGDEHRVVFGTAGIRFAGVDSWDMGEFTLAPYGSAAYRKAWRDRDGDLRASFTGGTVPFTVAGPLIAKDAAELSLGLQMRTGPVRISAGYNGSLAKEWTNHSGQVKFAIGF